MSVQEVYSPEAYPETAPLRDIAAAAAIKLRISAAQAEKTILLLDDGNTVPFITRYRKEVTGGLNEEQIQDIEDLADSLRTLHDRKGSVLRVIYEQGKLTPELAAAIFNAQTLQAVEDLYLPYKPKRKTRASIAREKGLEPLAVNILDQCYAGAPNAQELFDAFVASCVQPEKGVLTAEDAIAGAKDICAEIISENAELRAVFRAMYLKKGETKAKATGSAEELQQKDPKGVYSLYYAFTESVEKLAPYQILALNRAEREDIVRVGVDIISEEALAEINRAYPVKGNSPFARSLAEAEADSFKRLLAPSIERETRAELTKRAEEHAIRVFAENLRNLLMQAPLRGKRILGVDPGFVSGCKLAIIDETGKYIEGLNIYPHPPQQRRDTAKKILKELIAKHRIDAIAIGNGTASRETERLAAEVITELSEAQAAHIPGYTIVSEAGASVYSASEIARQEFPDLDATERGGISIARRLLDPLAELVKIDPKAIGVGMYQHDVDQKELAKELERVVASCVNFSGVNINTASAALLKYISGITARTAEAIVKHREKNGPFTSREQLTKVSGVGPATFVQAAGFLRVPSSKELLDNTFIHPESYDAARKLLNIIPGDGEDIAVRVSGWKNLLQLQEKKSKKNFLEETAQKIGVGAPTLRDMLESLEKTGVDPRDELTPPLLRHDVLSIDDLHEGMVVQGVVRNVVDFGAFIDIGVKQDGLAHISELSDQFVKDPMKVVAVGAIVKARVIGVDKARGRIQLSLRNIPKED